MKINIFKTQAVYVPLFFGAIFICLDYCPFAFIPDYAGLGFTENPGSILELLIQVTASILGICLAIIIIGFETFRKRFGRAGFTQFLHNKAVQTYPSIVSHIVISES